MTESFRTRAGRCVVENGRLRFERDGGGPVGTVVEALTSDEIPRWRRAAVVLVYVALVAGVALAVRVLPVWLVGVVVGVGLAVAVRSWLTRRGDGDDERIPVDEVVGVEAHDGVPLVSRPRFVVRYRSEGGVKHRFVQCPSRLYGFGSYEAGNRLFAERGLLDGDAPGVVDETAAVDT